MRRDLIIDWPKNVATEVLIVAKRLPSTVAAVQLLPLTGIFLMNALPYVRTRESRIKETLLLYK